jgi:hypothetical protein
MISADALVGDPDVARGGRGLETLRQDVGPAIVPVGGCAVSVGDGVAEDHDGGGCGRGEHVDCGDLIPVVDVLRIEEIGCGDEIAVGDVGGSTGAGMRGLADGRLVEVEGDREIGEISRVG